MKTLVSMFKLPVVKVVIVRVPEPPVNSMIASVVSEMPVAEVTKRSCVLS